MTYLEPDGSFYDHSSRLLALVSFLPVHYLAIEIIRMSQYQKLIQFCFYNRISQIFYHQHCRSLGLQIKPESSVCQKLETCKIKVNEKRSQKTIPISLLFIYLYMIYEYI